MSGDIQAVCTRLVSRFIHLQYDGICGMSIKAGNIATDHGAKALRASVQQAKMRDMEQQRTLRNADFSIVNIDAPPVPDASIQVTAIETFENEYEAMNTDERFWHGRRGHTFVMVMGPEGDWVIDDYSVEVLEETRGRSRGGSPSALARTVVMENARPRARDRQGAEQEPYERSVGRSQRKDRDSLRRQARALRSKSIRRILTILAVAALLAVVYVIAFGPHQRAVSVCLYTGLRHEKISLLGHTLRDTTKQTQVSAWILKWLDPPAETEDGHYWVPYGGWIKERGEDWQHLDPSPTTELALETLHELYKYRRLGDDVAIPFVQEYFDLMDPIVDALQNKEDAPPLKESEKELLYLQGRMNP